MQHLVTIGAEYMVVFNDTCKAIKALDNLNVEKHPSWSQISVLDISGDNSKYQEFIWVDPEIWNMDQPQFTCSPPCAAKIPPWTGATSTVDFPRITVSDGTWTSTITKAPLTISQWVFEVVTLTADDSNYNGKKVRGRQAFEEFMPKLATTPGWPDVTYTGPDGATHTTAPGNIAFPTPPPDLGNASDPPSGSWPKNPLLPILGQLDEPMIQQCGMFDFLCIDWTYGTIEGGPEDPDDENWEDLQVTCPTSTTSSSSSSRTTTTASPEPSPYEHGDPRENDWDCYNSGRTSDHERLDNAANSFCNHLGSSGDVLGENFFRDDSLSFPVSGLSLPLEVVLSLDVFEGCEWQWDYNECRRYLSVPVDSCNCGGVNGKQGGTVENNCLRWRIDPNTDL